MFNSYQKFVDFTSKIMYLKARYDSLDLFIHRNHSMNFTLLYCRLLTIVFLVLRDGTKNCFCQEYEKFSRGNFLSVPSATYQYFFTDLKKNFVRTV